MPPQLFGRPPGLFPRGRRGLRRPNEGPLENALRGASRRPWSAEARGQPACPAPARVSHPRRDGLRPPAPDEAAPPTNPSQAKRCARAAAGPRPPGNRRVTGRQGAHGASRVCVLEAAEPRGGGASEPAGPASGAQQRSPRLDPAGASRRRRRGNPGNRPRSAGAVEKVTSAPGASRPLPAARGEGLRWPGVPAPPHPALPLRTPRPAWRGDAGKGQLPPSPAAGRAGPRLTPSPSLPPPPRVPGEPLAGGPEPRRGREAESAAPLLHGLQSPGPAPHPPPRPRPVSLRLLPPGRGFGSYAVKRSQGGNEVSAASRPVRSPPRATARQRLRGPPRARRSPAGRTQVPPSPREARSSAGPPGAPHPHPHPRDLRCAASGALRAASARALLAVPVRGFETGDPRPAIKAETRGVLTLEGHTSQGPPSVTFSLETPSFTKVSMSSVDFSFWILSNPCELRAQVGFPGSALRHVPPSSLQMIPFRVFYRLAPLEGVTLFLFCSYFS